VKKIIAIGLFALALEGCANPASLEVTPSQAVIGENGFDAIEQTATNYLRLPWCPSTAATPICKTRTGVRAIEPAIRTARGDRDMIQTFLKANPGQPIPVTMQSAMAAAASNLQGLLAQYYPAH
jgi:hypothetical protein